MKVFFSHTGFHNLLPMYDVDVHGSFLDLVNEINAIHGLAGIKSKIVMGNKIASGARVFANVQIHETHINDRVFYKYYEKETTYEISGLNQALSEDIDNILISLFDPKVLLDLLNRGQAPNCNGDKVPFPYVDLEGTPKTMRCLPSIDNIDFDFDIKREYIYGFKPGETSLEQLRIERGEKASLAINDGEFDNHHTRLLPSDMVDAIRDIWELPDGTGSLRLFQEDALFFIMSKLLKATYPKEKQLLLSMPTGGGKTEAFMIPLLSHIYLQKQSGAPRCKERYYLPNKRASKRSSVSLRRNAI